MRTPSSPDRDDAVLPAVTLAVMDRDLARAVLIGRAPDGHRWPADYPTEGSLACAAAVMAAADAGRTDPFGAFVIVDGTTGHTVGDVLVHAPPDDRGTIDIGYGLAPSARGQGRATAAVFALMQWAFAHPEVTRITANTTDDNHGSIALMERVGMTVSHGPGGLVRGVAIRDFWRAGDTPDRHSPADGH
jgi:RimJ/RimL family protein N-acetyltransferase